MAKTISKIDPLKILTHSFWSRKAKQHSVWHFIYADDHGIAGLSSLSTSSYYDDSKNPPMRRRKFFGYRFSESDRELSFWVSPKGVITVCEGEKP